ncbi:prolyl oligopeptidase family serine peptidase [Epibacterium sp. MM17-32]|uniref:alpha/beta hydrolase family esterase n=1 Tax=Epibacterium sp. MM17-32 TaxID=2917734 RepID=UPI001EF73224|nr:PHB depolymerase family esterase [Epibacterium sp. MM17-32]MCG7628529.1 prolyl oligopeptidase family serine peptidase [Epibacterium sp. MM17-32]
MERLIPLCVAVALTAAGTARAGCGPVEPQCEIPGGSYEIALPPAATDTAGDPSPIPAVLFLHGHGGSAKGVLRMRGMVEAVTARGYAVIAPNGARRPNGPRSWSFLPEFQGRDDFAFLPAVVSDAAARFDIDPQNTVLAGFSSGAFMVNYLACDQPETFAAYLPVSGGFWRSQPESCTGPARIYHSHGWRDGVVPLEGRILGGGRFTQGDIWAGLESWRDTMGCDTHAPDRIWQDGELSLRRWQCGADAELVFELFPGGHMVPPGWADRVIDWIEAGAGPQAETD